MSATNTSFQSLFDAAVMTRGQIFMAPGKWLLRFLASLVELDADKLPPDLFWALSLVLTLMVWIQVIKILISVIKRVTGFDRQGPQR